jgi:hypothetical protein
MLGQSQLKTPLSTVHTGPGTRCRMSPIHPSGYLPAPPGVPRLHTIRDGGSASTPVCDRSTVGGPPSGRCGSPTGIGLGAEVGRRSRWGQRASIGRLRGSPAPLLSLAQGAHDF